MVQKARAGFGQAVDIRRADFLVAVAAEQPGADSIGGDEHDVRLLARGFGGECGHGQGG